MFAVLMAFWSHPTHSLAHPLARCTGTTGQRPRWQRLPWGTGASGSAPAVGARLGRARQPRRVIRAVQWRGAVPAVRNKADMSFRQPANVSTWMQKQFQYFFCSIINLFLQKNCHQNLHQRKSFLVFILSVIRTFSPKKRRESYERNYLCERKITYYNFS